MPETLSPAAQVEKLFRREKALADFGTFAFRETRLQTILIEAARVCAECLEVPFSKICEFRPPKDNLLVVAGHGWNPGVVGIATSRADGSSPQGRAFTTGKPQLCPNVDQVNSYSLPPFYPEHGILSTVDVLVAAKTGPPFGVLEVDSVISNAFTDHDIDFLTGFANVLAEAVASNGRAEDLRKTILRMEQLIEEKETLSQELKHRVRNNLHLVYGLLTAEIDGGSHSHGSVTAFRSIALRVVGLSEVFNHLLGVGMTRVINFGDYVNALCKSLPELYNEASITLVCQSNTVTVDLDEATALGMIVTELVNNAYLHAFPKGSGKISVEVRIAPGRFTLLIGDDGVGFVDGPTARRGMGLVRRLVKQVGGVLTLNSDAGTHWAVVVAKPQSEFLAA